MNKADEKVLAILKETFRSKKGELYDPDEFLSEQMLKGFLALSIVGMLAWIIVSLSVQQPSSELKQFVAVPITIF